jgi:hypothetical protein
MKFHRSEIVWQEIKKKEALGLLLNRFSIDYGQAPTVLVIPDVA